MKLREISRKAIAMLEEKSGYMVTVLEDPNLPTLASIRVARGNIPAHILTYKPGAKDETPDFTICWQCAMSMRMFECPPDQRFLIASNQDGDRILEAILKAPNGFEQKFGLNQAQLESFKQQLLGGMITHLRSVPIGLRVSEKLTLDFRELLELETQNVEKELAIAKETLSARIKEMMPVEVYSPTQYINAAYALFWAERLERPVIANPFQQGGFDRHGQQLLNILDTIPADPTHDYELIDAWADYLGIHSWYTWLPYQAP